MTNRNARATDAKVMLEYFRFKGSKRSFYYVFRNSRIKKQLAICLMLMGCLVLVEPLKGGIFVIAMVTVNIIRYVIHRYIVGSKSEHNFDLQHLSVLTCVLLARFLFK